MTQEDKNLLLKDLSSRLPYGVILNCCNIVGEKLYTIDSNGLVNEDYDLEEVKPYLFPLSSMTKEQKREYENALVYHDYVKGGWTIAKSFDDEYIIPYWFVDFCNKNHFDYHGLIPMGLASDATGLNIY